MTSAPDPLVNFREMGLYRPNVGLAIFSKRGHVLLGHRASTRKSELKYAWQMPQGGIDRGETPLEAAVRELGEETGLAEQHVELLEEIEPWLFYDFPPDLKARLQGPFYGQRQKWFAFRLLGSDTDVRLDLHTPEFDSWRWANLSEAPDLVIPFKQQVYQEVAKRFEHWTQPV